MEHFEGALRGQGFTPTRRQKIQEWEERVHETGVTVDDVSELEKILKRAIILRDIAGEDIYNSGKYQGWHRPVEQRTRLTLVTLRSSMVCMPEPADWPWMPV